MIRRSLMAVIVWLALAWPASAQTPFPVPATSGIVTSTDAVPFSLGAFMLPFGPSVIQVHLVVIAQDVNTPSDATVWVADYSFYRDTYQGPATRISVGNRLKQASSGAAGKWDLDLSTSAQGEWTITATGDTGKTVNWVATGQVFGLFPPQ